MFGPALIRVRKASSRMDQDPGLWWLLLLLGFSGVLSSKAAHRVRRGWNWSQMFVKEEDPTPRTIGQLKSSDDTGDFTIKYILSGEGAGEIFIMDEFTGDIHALQPLDREHKPFYVMQAQAIHRRTQQPVEPESEFIITVEDINDNAPLFIHQPYLAHIQEMCPKGTTVIQVTATDADDPTFENHAKLLYSLLQGAPYFTIEPKTGIIVTSWNSMDREAREEFQVVVQVEDMLGFPGAFSATTTVTIHLEDVNDNGPVFQHNLYTFSLSESAAVGTTVGRIKADDSDVGVNAEMIYTLEDLEDSRTFEIQTDPDTQEGVVVLAQPLDYESKRRFVMGAEALNRNPDPRFLSPPDARDRTTLRISVRNVDEPPLFSEPLYSWKVLENVPVGTEVGRVSARDPDGTDSPVRYSLAPPRGRFRVDPVNGTVCVVDLLDRETEEHYNLSVTARETREEQLSSLVSVSITVLDVNDNAPTLSREYQPYVCEGTQAGELVELISATDADEPVDGHHFYFSMIPDKHLNPNFTIRDNQDNTASVLARRSSFTLLEQTLFLLPVVITDSGSPVLTSTSTLSLSVCACLPARTCLSAGAGSQGLGAGLMLSVLLLASAVLTALMLAAGRCRTLRREKVQPEAEQRRRSPESKPRPPVLLRSQRLRRDAVSSSIRMSLRQSHLIGPGDEAFQLFMMERLAEADGDPHVPPFDLLHLYAYEGTGSSTGSLSSLESHASLRMLRFSHWPGSGGEENTF